MKKETRPAFIDDFRLRARRDDLLHVLTFEENTSAVKSSPCAIPRNLPSLASLRSRSLSYLNLGEMQRRWVPCFGDGDAAKKVGPLVALKYGELSHA